jgi:hypothetical protein
MKDFICLVLGYGSLVRADALGTMRKQAAFFAGVLAMGIFLSMVFTR